MNVKRFFQVGKRAGVMFDKFITVYPCVKVLKIKELSFAITHIRYFSGSYHFGNSPRTTGKVFPRLPNGNKAFSLNCLFIFSRQILLPPLQMVTM